MQDVEEVDYFIALPRESCFLFVSIFVPPVLFTGPHQFWWYRCTQSNQLAAASTLVLLGLRAYGSEFTVLTFRVLGFGV